MKYIDLTLISDPNKKNEGTATTITNAVNNNHHVVILGAPGAGKSSLLKKYLQENKSNSDLVTFRDIYLEKVEITKDYGVILIDGLDEYRVNITDNKAYVLSDVLLNITKKYPNKKIILSCREMDWFEEQDKKDCMSILNKQVSIFNIAALNYKQKIELAKSYNIPNVELFVSKYDQYGFLQTPQLLKMIAEICDSESEEITTKKDLYIRFIEHCNMENNDIHHIANSTTRISHERFRYIAGYMALFNFFSSVTSWDKDFIYKLGDLKNTINQKELLDVLRSKLFSDKQFIHRTVAEFLAADYLTELMQQDKSEERKQLLLSLFYYNDRIPSPIRGVYSWLCSFLKDSKLIEYDPYQQMIYGDNSIFDLEMKKNVVLAVKKMSKRAPYFFCFTSYSELTTFYESGLEDFLKDEFNNALALNMEGHYPSFIAYLLSHTRDPSPCLRQWARVKISDKRVSSYDRRNLLKLFSEDYTYLKQILEDIIQEKILDKDGRLKLWILNILVPHTISPSNIKNYLALLPKNTFHEYMFLRNIPFEEMDEIIFDILYSLGANKNKKIYEIPSEYSHFYDRYNEELVLKYEKDKDIKYIKCKLLSLSALIQKKVSYHEDKISFYEAEFSINNQSIISEIADRLFSLVFDDYLHTYKYEFHYERFLRSFLRMFPFRSNIKITSIIHEKMQSAKDHRIKCLLYRLWIRVTEHKERDWKKYKKFAEENGFLNLYTSFHKKAHTQYARQSSKKWRTEEKEKERRLRHDRYYSKLSDNDIICNKLIINRIIQYFFYTNQKPPLMSSSTASRLKNILKNYNFTHEELDMLSTSALIKDQSLPNREIDDLCRASYSLKENMAIGNLSMDFKIYLYFLFLYRGHTQDDIRIKHFHEIKNSICIKTAVSDFILNLSDQVNQGLKAFLQDIFQNKTAPEFYETFLESFFFASGNIESKLFLTVLKFCGFSLKSKKLSELSGIINDTEIESYLKALDNYINSEMLGIDRNFIPQFYTLVGSHGENLKWMDSQTKVHVINFFFRLFDTKKSIAYENKVYKNEENLAIEISRDFLYYLDRLELESLINIRSKIHDDIWINNIKHHIELREQDSAIKSFKFLTIHELNMLLFKNSIVTPESFFAFIQSNLDSIKQMIEINEDNEKSHFYTAEEKSEKENLCRDLIYAFFNQRLVKENITLVREKNIENYRVDIKCTHNISPDCNVHIECKRDTNSQLISGVSDQLAEKYVKRNPKAYGIYLVFGFKKDPTKHIPLIEEHIPISLKGRIKVVWIDLRRGI